MSYKNKILALIVAALLVGGMGYIIFMSFTGILKTDLEGRYDLEESSIKSEVVPDTALVVDVTIERITIEEESSELTEETMVSVPNLDRPIVFEENVLPEVKEKMTKKIKDLSDLLRQDHNLFNVWIELGLVRKSIDDFEGAREAWEYASSIRLQNSLSFGNLGVLYGYYLDDPVQAEANFLQAIKNDPHAEYLYVQLYDFYQEALFDGVKARHIVEQGIHTNPNSLVLKSLIGE